MKKGTSLRNIGYVVINISALDSFLSLTFLVLIEVDFKSPQLIKHLYGTLSTLSDYLTTKIASITSYCESRMNDVNKDEYVTKHGILCVCLCSFLAA